MAGENFERTRRRAKQAVHAEQALDEAINLLPPQGEEKVVLVEENKVRDLARFGESKAEGTRIAQQANRTAGEIEALQLQVKAQPVPVLIPGQQVSLQTANLMARAADSAEINAIDSAARASARAVRTVLMDTENPVLERHQRHRNEMSIAAAAAAQAKET